MISTFLKNVFWVAYGKSVESNYIPKVLST